MTSPSSDSKVVDPILHVVMVNPEIPPNTGNVARICALTGCSLHLVRPLGFFLDDKRMKRAGLDYWHLLDLRIHDSIEEVRQQLVGHNFYYATTKGKRAHSEVKYRHGDVVVFGPETRGLSEEVLEGNWESTIRIPMRDLPEARSLNLSNSVSIVVYEALRQLEYPGLT